MRPRIDDRDQVIRDIDAIYWAVGVDCGVAPVGADFIMHVALLGAPVPECHDKIPLESLRPRRRRWRFPSHEAVGPVREHFQTARAAELAHGVAH